MRTISVFGLAAIACAAMALSQQRPGNGPGPWDNDVLIFRASANGRVEQLAAFARAGVPTLARLNDGSLIVAHQHFPKNNDADFDRVAARFSADEGKTWTAPQVIVLEGFPDGMRPPFDPTLVPLAYSACEECRNPNRVAASD
jgi:hypothetical protein